MGRAMNHQETLGMSMYKRHRKQQRQSNPKSLANNDGQKMRREGLLANGRGECLPNRK
jgi:hypothetical protein